MTDRHATMSLGRAAWLTLRGLQVFPPLTWGRVGRGVRAMAARTMARLSPLGWPIGIAIRLALWSGWWVRPRRWEGYALRASLEPFQWLVGLRVVPDPDRGGRLFAPAVGDLLVWWTVVPPAHVLTEYSSRTRDA